jgi:hypothetical protein
MSGTLPISHWVESVRTIGAGRPDGRRSLALTPDGRYLMTARRFVQAANGDPEALASARADVDRAKRSLGERGPVWWSDGAPDFNRSLVRNSPYEDWWQTQLSPGA